MELLVITVAVALGACIQSAVVILLPGMLAGYGRSGVAAAVLDRGYTRLAVLAFASLSSIALLARELAF